MGNWPHNQHAPGLPAKWQGIIAKYEKDMAKANLVARKDRKGRRRQQNEERYEPGS